MVTLGKYAFERLDERNIVLGVLNKSTKELKPNTITYHGDLPSVLRALREKVLQDKVFYGAKALSFEEFMGKLEKSCKEFDRLLTNLEFGNPNFWEALEPPEQAKQPKQTKPATKQKEVRHARKTAKRK
jgi:hypothetical protein